jgi:Fe-S-cluster-containing dehydrogenase component
MTERAQSFDLEKLRRRARERAGMPWMDVDELFDDAAVRAWIEAEFPAAAAGLNGPGRREFIKLMGASLMLAGLAGCGDGRSDLALPFVEAPEDAIPGVPRFYATAVMLDGYAQPVLATTHAGRPTKLDGNPDHPATRGRSDAFMQMAVLQLYDPSRSKVPLRNGVETTWAAFERYLAGLRAEWMKRRGEGVRILTGAMTSPTIVRQVRQITSDLPGARVHVFEPAGQDLRARALRSAFGRDVDMRYALENCEVVVSLDDDFLGPGPWQVFHARAWSHRRGEVRPGEGRGRLYMAESVPGLTGVVADRRLGADLSRMSMLATALAVRLGAGGENPSALTAAERAWVEAAAKDLEAHRGKALVTFGPHLPIDVQALAPWMNERLGNAGQTVSYSEPAAFQPGQGGGLADLARDIDAGAVDSLVILDSNPVYTAPAALRFGDLLAKVRNRIHVGLYRDETARLCGWHLPLSHALESFGDARAVDGTVTLLQPVLAPLYATRTMPQILAMLAGDIDPPAEAPVPATWTATFGDDFDRRWRQSLHDGFVAASAPAPVTVTPAAPTLPSGQTGAGDTVEIVFRPDPCVWDGRFAAVAWLQELPKPLTKLTWDCPVAVSPKIAERFGLSNGDIVEVAIDGRKLTGPAWIMPGQAANTVALSLGYGRDRAGQIDHALGYSAYALRPLDNAWLARGTIRRVGGQRTLATTQRHHRLDGFDFVKEVTSAAPQLPPSKDQHSFYPPRHAEPVAWGMVIDLDRCIGCNACVAACNVENNVLVVGKDQVAMGREMLWLRVDRYYDGDIENPKSFFQPVPCMHCEHAPCEMGCPVNATVHSPDGVNQQVYNRCIGTRTCSSYCPYKVRRFNWYDYRRLDEANRAAHNPDVTVRSRGVMEKCTYCTQRIQAARVAADKENRALAAGEVVTACQLACPTSAISFGNISNPDETVSKLRRSGRHYVLLEHLGTRPRTTYLARWRDDGDGEGT